MKRGTYLGGSTIIGPRTRTLESDNPSVPAPTKQQRRDADAKKAAALAACKRKMAVQKALRLATPPPSPTAPAPRSDRRMRDVEVLVRKSGGILIVAKPGKTGSTKAPVRPLLGVKAKGKGD